jgi:hypothetical protein
MTSMFTPFIVACLTNFSSCLQQQELNCITLWHSFAWSQWGDHASTLFSAQHVCLYQDPCCVKHGMCNLHILAIPHIPGDSVNLAVNV